MKKPKNTNKTNTKVQGLGDKKTLGQGHKDADGEGGRTLEQSVVDAGRRIKDREELESEPEVTIVDCLDQAAPPVGRLPPGDQQDPASPVLNHFEDDPWNDFGGGMEESESDPPELGECVDPRRRGTPVPGEEGSGPMWPLRDEVIRVETTHGVPDVDEG